MLAIPPDSDVEFYEVKRKNGKASKLQEYRLKELNNLNIKAEIYRGD